ncbi:hypothetical protein ACQ4WX_49920 [Streptomyces lasalocidi]
MASVEARCCSPPVLPFAPTRLSRPVGSGPGFAALRLAASHHAVVHAPVGVRRAVERRGRRAPGWSETKADHLPDRPECIRTAPSNRWQTAAARTLLARVAEAGEAAADFADRVRAMAGPRLTACRFTLPAPGLTPGLDLVFDRRGHRHAFARALAGAGIPSGWNYYPLHRMAPYASYATGPMPGADHLWPRILTVPGQRQPRLTAGRLAEALLAADAAVRREAEHA